MKRWIVGALAALLVISGAALAEENTVEVLPPAPPVPEIQVEANEYAFPDMEAYYQVDDPGQTPTLMEAEIKRLPAIEEAYTAGSRPSESILNRMENVHVSVLRLIPEDYEGESWYLLLPEREMTDEELLQIVDAFGQMDLSFDPSMVSWHNCMRGGTNESTRTFSEDERERWRTLRTLYDRGGLKPEKPFTPIVEDDGIGMVTLDEEDYSGLPEMDFYPARRMTDEELLALYAWQQGEPAQSGDQLAIYEMQLRQELHDKMGMPYAVQMLHEYVQSADAGNVYGDSREVYGASFQEIGGKQRTWGGSIHTETGKLISAQTEPNSDWLTKGIWSDVREDPYDQRWRDMALETVRSVRADGLAALDQAISWSESNCNQLHSALIRVRMQDGACYRIRICYVLQDAGMLEYNDAESIACEDSFYLSMLEEGNINE